MDVQSKVALDVKMSRTAMLCAPEVLEVLEER